MPQLIKPLIGTIIQESPKYGKVILLDTNSTDGYLYNYTKCKIKFLNTGYENILTYDTIKKNKIRDYLTPEICGIACVGYARNSDDPQVYKLWASMIHKCYDPNNKYYKSFGALGFTVCEDWLRFDNFLADYYKYERPNCDPSIQVQFRIKPELISKGCKEFSFENCSLFANELDIKFGKVYHSNQYGDYIPIEYTRDKNGNKAVIIRFVLTGYEDIINPFRVLNGSVMDPFFPKIHGIGYLGSGTTKNNIREYGIWARMMSRCYNINDKSYSYYGGAGVTVCERWHNFTNFLEDIKKLPNYDKWLENKEQYELDKDYLQPGKLKSLVVYSPSTCCFLPSKDNIAISSLNIHTDSNKEYIGVYQDSVGNYVVKIMVNGELKYIGTYSTIEAAVNARNWWISWYNYAMVSDNINYMLPEQWTQYRIGSKQLYHLI